jgi:hypothetical protein
MTYQLRVISPFITVLLQVNVLEMEKKTFLKFDISLNLSTINYKHILISNIKVYFC